MIFRIILIISFILPLCLYAEERLWVYFTDKGPVLPKLSTDDIRNVLTQRAIDRRLQRAADPYFDETDLPVYQEYMRRLRDRGVRIYRKSKWLNAVSIHRDNLDLQSIRNLPFVSDIAPVQAHRFRNKIDRIDTKLFKSSSTDYGPSFNQNDMIGIPVAHSIGFAGQGVRIAMFDSGFILEHESLQHLEIIDAYDFVQNDTVVANQEGDSFSQHNHGTLVLSAIGGYQSGQLIGPAYQAEYLLAKTEDISSERHVEEDNWVFAAEWADSLGADVISTSLGYSVFDPGEGNYTYADMNGDNTIITKAADLAARKGILVFSSAGNEGASSWFYITAPADGDSVIAVGGVQPDKSMWGGSSKGPTSDGRIKPDIMAQGISVYSATPNTVDRYSYASGTSLACPLAAGAGAILLSMNPDLDPMQIRDILRMTASRADNPDNNYGYGIINLGKAISAMEGNSIVQVSSFVAVAKPGKNLIQWISTVEIENKFWILKRQIGDMPLESVSQLPGMKFSMNAQLYTITDSKIQGGETIFYSLWSVDTNGSEKLIDSAQVTSLHASSLSLLQSFPNPFNNTTRITFGLNSPGNVSLTIYDALGRRVSTLIDDEYREAQYHSVTWSGTADNGYQLASGMYFAVLTAASKAKRIKLLLMR